MKIAVVRETRDNEATQVVFMGRAIRPRFAGIENGLHYESHTTLLIGDAKALQPKFVAAVKAL